MVRVGIALAFTLFAMSDIIYIGNCRHEKLQIRVIFIACTSVTYEVHSLQLSRCHLPSLVPGGRTSDEIIVWLKKKTGPPAQDLPTPDDATAFIEKDEVVVIGFFEDAESEAAKAYIAAADSEDTVYFGITTSKEVAEALEATFDSIVVLKKVGGCILFQYCVMTGC